MFQKPNFSICSKNVVQGSRDRKKGEGKTRKCTYKRFLFGLTRIKRAWPGSASPRKISGRRWKRVSPRRPPTAKATMTEREEGSIFGGHNARRKSRIS